MSRQTDRQTDKSSRWAFTAFESQWSLFDKDQLKEHTIVKDCGWQEEVCPDTQRRHYQGYMLTQRQVRLSQLVKEFPGVHFEVARDWMKLLNYCRKTDTAVPDSQVKYSSDRQYLNMHSAFILLGKEYAENKEDFYNDLLEYTKLQGAKDPDVFEYKWLSRRLVDKQPEDVAVYSNPQFQRAWIDYGRTFKRLALDALEAVQEQVPDSITREPSESEVELEFISPA